MKVYIFKSNPKRRLLHILIMSLISLGIGLMAFIISLIMWLGDKSSFGTWKFVTILIYTFFFLSIEIFASVFISMIPNQYARIGTSIGGIFIGIILTIILFIIFHIDVFLCSKEGLEAEPSVAWEYSKADPIVVGTSLAVYLGFSIFTVIRLLISRKKEKRTEVVENN